MDVNAPRATDLPHYWRCIEAALGPRARWSGGLRLLVQVMLESQAPQQLLWGPEMRVIHNAAFEPILGARADEAQGRPLLEVWPELAEELQALAEPVWRGEAVSYDDRPFLVRRNGLDEMVWMTFAWTPVRETDDRVAGIHVAISETTGRVLADRAQAETTSHLKRLFEQAPGFIAFLTGPDHEFALANRAYMQLVRRDDLVGRTVAAALPEVVEQGFVQLLDRVYRTGTPYVGRRVPIELDVEGRARVHYVDFVYQPVADPDGRISGIFVQGADVTEHVLAEEALRERTEEALAAAADASAEHGRLQALLRAAPVGILCVDANGGLLLANNSMRELYGDDLPETRSRGDYGRWQGRWADSGSRYGTPIAAHEWPIARALDGDDPAPVLIEVTPSGGHAARTLLVHATPVRDARGTVAGAVATVQDLTERIAIEARLRESEARFRTITNAMPQMVWSARPDGYHDYFNRQWYAFTGVSEGSTDGDAWAQLFHQDDRARMHARWQESLTTGCDYEIDYRLRHRSGDYRWVLGRAAPLRNDDGSIRRWLGTCTDIHDMRMLQAELQHSRNALALANERKDTFLATLAHELRNPLAPIGTAAQLLRRSPEAPENVRRASEIIERQVRHIAALVDDLTDVARVTRGLVEYARAPLDLREPLQVALEQVRPMLERAGHALDLTGLASHPLPVRGDGVRLTQVFANLVANAAKYTPPGGTISVAARRGDDAIEVSVRDTGIGIDAALLPHVFELFTRSDRDEARTQGGLGIGLAVVQRIVTAHGGRIVAESAGPGHGSEFTVTLPEQGAEPTSGSPTGNAPSTGRTTVIGPR